MAISDKKRCQALIDAEIDDPRSKEGIIFCTRHCPYDKCVVLDVEDGRGTSSRLMKELRVTEAKRMSESGYSIENIAKTLGVSERTVRMYLE